MARQPALKPRSIGVLIFEDFQLLDAAGPIGAFEMPMRGMQPPPYSLQVIAPSAGPVRSSSGVVWTADVMPRQPKYDTVVIAGHGAPLRRTPRMVFRRARIGKPAIHLRADPRGRLLRQARHQQRQRRGGFGQQTDAGRQAHLAPVAQHGHLFA